MALNPRDTLAQVASMYGYDPAVVMSVNLSQDEAVIVFRLTAPQGFTVVSHGYLMTDSTRTKLDAMAQAYGYDPGQVVGVRIEQHESEVRYRVTHDGVTSAIQTDTFGIPDPAPTPAIAATDTGKQPA